MFDFLQRLFSRQATAGSQAAVAQFRRFETDLQQDFFQLAAGLGSPRGLRWISCDWLQDLAIVVDPQTRLVSAFAGLNIGFEAVAGSDMEDVAAVSTIRDGSAVFHFQQQGWGSAGRVVFNMDPWQAARHLAPQAHLVFERKHDR